MVIRPARRGEAAALSALCFRSKASWGYDDAFMARCRAALTVREASIAAGHVLVAAGEDGEPAGVAAIAVDGDTAELDLLFVDPPAFRRGIGAALLRAAIGRAREAGAGRMTILADPGAQPFYEAMGARFERFAPSDAIAGRSLPRLVLALR